MRSRAIDGKKLREAIYSKGLTLHSASTAMGYGIGMLQQTCSRGVMSEHAIAAMERVHGIPYEDYKPEWPLSGQQKAEMIDITCAVGMVEEQLGEILRRLNILWGMEGKHGRT
jgi:hypothetical protein